MRRNSRLGTQITGRVGQGGGGRIASGKKRAGCLLGKVASVERHNCLDIKG